MMKSCSSLLLTAAFVFAGWLTEPHQRASAQSPVLRTHSTHAYIWFPNGDVRRVSPGAASSQTSAMPGWGVFGQPHIHPDGTAVVFWGGVSGVPRVWLYETGAQSARPLTKIDVGSFEPSFDWTGKRIVFAADVVDAVAPEMLTTRTSWQRTISNLFVMNLDGGALHQITRGNFQDSRPAFSPDGEHVVFLSNRASNRGGLYVVATDGSTAPRQVLNESGFGRPWFSPDGKFIYAHYYGVAPFVASEHVRIW